MPPVIQDLPPIAVALSGDSMLDRAADAITQGFRFFEFRLDTASDPHEAVFDMGALLRRNPSLRAIATCRRAQNGGSFHGTAADEMEMLRQCSIVGAHILDLSLETAEESLINPHALTPLSRGPGALMLSWHHFSSTPSLSPVLGRMRAVGADLYKIVPTAVTLRDSFALLDLLDQNREAGNLVAMSMGSAGMLTRILGCSHGSRFTFASPGAGAETAPGQIDAVTLRDLYRIENITPQTEVYGVFGKPVTSSRSPVMLNTAFRCAGRDAVYVPLETDSADELFDTWQRLDLRGASVTMPIKEQILPGLAKLGPDTLAPDAAALGAANTLQRSQDCGIYGSNTDVTGILQPLASCMQLAGATALVVGAGGVARAALFALRQAGCTVFLVNRTPERAAALADQMGAQALAPDQIADRTFDIVLNATPHGMAGQSAAWPISFDAIKCRIFFDLVYNPIETPLIQKARKRDLQAIPGVEMFLAQGAAQFEAWTGSPAPREVMRTAVLNALVTSKLS